MSEGKEDEAATRKYGTKKKAIEKIRTFGYQAQGKSQWKAFRPDEFLPESEAKDPEKQAQTKKKPVGKVAKIDYLLPTDLKVEIGSPKLSRLIEEAKRIDISQFFNSGAVFLRCILEMTLNEAIAFRKCKPAILKAHPTKIYNGEVNVSTILEEVKPGKAFDLGLTSEELRGVKHLTADGPLSYDVFHLFVHNSHWPATHEALIALRENVLPIIRKALLRPLGGS